MPYGSVPTRQREESPQTLPLSSQRIFNTACVKPWAPMRFELRRGDCSPGSGAKFLFLQAKDVLPVTFVY